MAQPPVRRGGLKPASVLMKGSPLYFMEALFRAGSREFIIVCNSELIIELTDDTEFEDNSLRHAILKVGSSQLREHAFKNGSVIAMEQFAIALAEQPVYHFDIGSSWRTFQIEALGVDGAIVKF